MTTLSRQNLQTPQMLGKLRNIIKPFGLLMITASIIQWVLLCNTSEKWERNNDIAGRAFIYLICAGIGMYCLSNSNTKTWIGKNELITGLGFLLFALIFWLSYLLPNLVQNEYSIYPLIMGLGLWNLYFTFRYFKDKLHHGR